MKNSIVAIGDIHGCAESLSQLLKKLQPYRGSTFVFLGDYIDRGPSSRDVFDILIDFSRSEECVFLRGNHEAMMLDAIASGDEYMWILNGGRQTLKTFDMQWPEEFVNSHYYRFISETLYYYQTDEFFFTHGGLDPNVTIQDNLDTRPLNSFLWERSHVNVERPNWHKALVFGHTPMRQPMNEPLKIGIDTGCVFNTAREPGVLTAVILPERKFIQQPNIDNN